MKWPWFGLVVFLFVGSIGGAPSGMPSGEPPADLKPVVDGNGAFAFELYGRLKAGGGNLFLSPYSVSAAVGTAYGGARGDTAKQMASTLHFPADQRRFRAGMAAVHHTFAQIDRSRHVELNAANGLWPQRDYRLNPEFVSLAKEQSGASVDPVDYVRGSGTACDRINGWVEHQTKGKIKNAVSPGLVSPNTRLVIVNAIYFKGDWASRFDAKDTRPESFWSMPERSVEVPMMRQQHVFRYAEPTGLQVLELPYLGYDLSMLILLPAERTGLFDLERRLNYANLVKWTKAFELRTVDVRLPKFAMESRFSLTEPLASMGMHDAFHGDRADFSGISSNRPLFIGAVEHAACIEVDEQGTVAAAATGISMGCAASAAPPPALFHADHPFLFLIRDNHTGTILFFGRVANPAR